MLGLVVATLNSVLEFYQRLAELPLWLRVPLIALGARAAASRSAGCSGVWRARRGVRGMTAHAPVSRAEVESRIDALRARKAETAALEAELVELDRRRAGGEVYVAMFGEISTGKSSLIRALARDAAPDVDVRGGTTRTKSATIAAACRTDAISCSPTCPAAAKSTAACASRSRATRRCARMRSSMSPRRT